IETGHAPGLSDLFRARQLFRRLFLTLFLLRLFAQALVMLAVNFRVEFELRFQFVDQLRVGVKNKVHVKAGVERSGSVGKRPPVHFLHLFNLGAFLLKLGLQAIDNVMHTVLFSLRIDHEQGFITILHGSFSSILLKVFIAETTPLSTAHFTASAARSIVDLASPFSSSKKLLST